MKLYTKEQIARMVFAPNDIEENNCEYYRLAVQRAIDKVCSWGQEKFVRNTRKSTGLLICAFAPDRFYIKY